MSEFTFIYRLSHTVSLFNFCFPSSANTTTSSSLLLFQWCHCWSAEDLERVGVVSLTDHLQSFLVWNSLNCAVSQLWFGFSLLLFSNNGADVRVNTFSLSESFFLLLPSHSCKQTEAGKLKGGRQSNPSSISLSWLLIQVPDAPGSSANSVCVSVGSL